MKVDLEELVKYTLEHKYGVGIISMKTLSVGMYEIEAIGKDGVFKANIGLMLVEFEVSNVDQKR